MAEPTHRPPSRIGECARVQKGSFYHFFPSKRDLALAVIDEAWRRWGRAARRRSPTGSLPPLERIARSLEAGLEEQVRLKAENGAVPGCHFAAACWSRPATSTRCCGSASSGSSPTGPR